MYNFTWLSNPGTLLLLSGIVVAIVYKVSAQQAVRTFGAMVFKLRWSMLTIATVLALAYVMNLSGQTISIGTWIASVGPIFAFLSPTLGWIGTAVTGSDTSANALFATLQQTAGVNAGGGERAYRAVYVPWGTPAGKWVIGGASFGEATATALGIPYVLGVAEGISRARYYPGVQKVKVKLLAEPGTLRLIGAQMIGGGEGIKERADFLAQAIRFGMTLHDLSTMENVYSPAIGALNEPMVVAATNGVAEAAKQAAAKKKG